MANWLSLGAVLNGSHGEEPTGKDLFKSAARAPKKGARSEAGVEGETPKRVTVPFELTLAVNERAKAQLDERRTSAAISGKVAAMVSLSG